MKVMISAFVAALVIASLAPVVLDQFGWSSAEQASSESVRLE
ncbi:hypothetical protein QQF73_01155 [Marinobacter sp. M216]|uniref:Uncharacterized protein n=1 Tax=Marinobacter albus TaxID=3030833 RepID=A0ABT7H773_9GAMM|nr:MULTISPECIES: hypothetical protein [unclassified Marinobacter]MDK9556214.1 hypothetical protein [Marinobacter sp. M216]